ncbi:hypothetical protein PF006_g5320 [Phytophthora fragariae]|uniref:receptor protein-tyrosine kinase n=1 Tax=Phytophthora fragariae TaxID=53985 RepID=A0A6A3FD48_9STRA|nr:hypothetical protein PF003_g25881 [Phytophthora fragariae]KAE8943519.1 hypothetical protein PF009_g6749 [Phytophthora fragariae]KAE9150275.1 hypothetical protein PF006_g5320 [Phytophthora fragariae]
MVMAGYEIPAELRASLTPAQGEELAAQFRISDADGSGAIDEREFRALLGRMGIELSAAETDALVSSIDVNGDGLLDFAELVQMVVRLQRGDAKLLALRKFMETLDTTPVALLEREATKFGLQVVYQLVEREEDSDEDETELAQMQLTLVGKVCGPTGRVTVRATGKTTREAKFKAAEVGLVKIKKLQPGLAVEPGELPDQWEKWLFGNIERGASVKKLMHTLAQKGFLLTGNELMMQRISTRASSFRLRTKRNAPSGVYGSGVDASFGSDNNNTSRSGSPIKSSRTARSIAAVEKLPSPPVQVLQPQWAHWCQQELARGIDGNVVLSELVSQGFEPDRSPLFTQRLLRVVKNRDDRCSNSAESPRTAGNKPFSFLRVLEEGILKEVELFVFCGQDVNALQLDANTKLMQSPLHIASKHGYYAIAKLLIERGAEVDHLDSFRRTPLMVAARCGHSEITALMLEHGANIFQLDNLKNSTLHLAAFSGSSTIASQLLSAHDDSFRLFKTNLPQRRGGCYEQLLQKTYDTIMKSKLRDNERRRFHVSWLFESVQWLHAEMFGSGGDNSRICKMPVPQKAFMDYLVTRYHKKHPKHGIHDELATMGDNDSEEDEEGTEDEQARRRKEGDPADWISASEMSFFVDTCFREMYKNLPNLQGRTALHVACEENLVCTHERVIQCLAEKNGCSPFLLDHSGRTPLQLLLACRGRPGSPKGDAFHEQQVIQQRVERVHSKEVRLEEERVAHRRKVWQDELERMSRDFNELDTLNRMRNLVKENDGKPVARGTGWDIYEEPLSHNRLFENTRSGFVQRQVPTQIVEEGRTRLGWKEKMETSAHFVECHRSHPTWELHRVNGTDVYFFFNRESEQCQWVSPEGLSIREWRTKRFFKNAEQLEDEPDQESLVVKFSGTASAAVVDNAVKGRTLGDWRECRGFGGVTFYLHAVDKRVVVEKPVEVLLHEGYRYAQTLIFERSEEIETHDRGWHRYYDPDTSHTFYLNELSGDCVHDTFSTKKFLQEIRRPKRQARFALTTEELRRRREEQEWKSALQRARRHDEQLKTAEEQNVVATDQQKREKEELEIALRQLESSVTGEHLTIAGDDENQGERETDNNLKNRTQAMTKRRKNNKGRSLAYIDARFRREREVFLRARENNILTSIDPARVDPRREIERSQELEQEMNEEELENARLEDTDTKPAIRERRRVSRILTRTDERLHLGRALCRWGCEQWFPREFSLEEHERVECVRRLMVCRLGCTMVMERRQWRDVIYDHESEHEEQCSSRIVYCPRDCGVWLPHFDLAVPHMRDLCVRRPVGDLRCRLGCGRVYQGGAHQLLTLEQTRLAHEQDDCELRKVKCTWPKCNAMILAKERNAHRRVHLLSSGILSFVTAEVHEYKVPRDVKLLKFQAWGAGGGSGLLRGQTVGHGGGGAFVEGICPVFPGETLYFSVGSGGSGGKFARMAEAPDDAVTDNIDGGKKTKTVPGGVLVATQVSTAAGGFPGGGQGHSGNKESACGGGGGFTSIYRQGAYGIEYILIAAGGGGGGTCRNGSGGGACKARKLREGDDVRCGCPGGDAAGGAAGACDEFNPICKFVGTNGASMQGGDGAEFGGGGGGGLFGGGGGGFAPGIVGGGGGGSSYINASLLNLKSIRVEAGGVVKPGGMDENPPQSVQSAYWDVVDGVAGEGGTGSTRAVARGNHGGVRIARPGFFDDMKFHR